MKAIFLLTVGFSLLAANFIDNPNFDSGVHGWLRDPVATTVSYNEHTRLNIVNDQYLGPVFGAIYEMTNVPGNLPLYFVVEIGAIDKQPIYLEVQLFEYYRRVTGGSVTCDEFEAGCSRHPPRFVDCDMVSKVCPRPHKALLSTKKITLKGSDVWHLIISDYPAYKKKDDSTVKIEIRSLNGHPIELNYAQVGTDPKSLGGRGARRKNFYPENKEEL